MSDLFAVHKLNDEGLVKAAKIAAVFSDALATLEEVCPVGRELSIAKTKLEEACFFAKKAMASEMQNQQLGTEQLR